MTKFDLIEKLAASHPELSIREAERAVKILLEQMTSTLEQGERIEVRGFGSFAVRYRGPRMGRNPKSGESVALPGKFVPHFKAGKRLRDRVNDGMLRQKPADAGGVDDPLD